MNRFGFVILHYMTIDDTVGCVNSIIRNVDNPIIVIVDNASSNNTGIELKKLYKNFDNIIVILNKNNLGFAKGNNIGISYLRENYNCSFITVLNNDTVILSEDFTDNIDREFKNSGFAVLGPKIYTLDNNTSSNPVAIKTDTIVKTKKLIMRKKIKLLLCYMHFDKWLNNAGDRLLSDNTFYNCDLRYENVKLHGSCWVFSENYFKKLEKLNESTFLYFEEDILYIELMKNKLKTVYCPDIKIKHLEDSSTNMITKNNHNKNLFVLKNEIKSLYVLLRILKNKE